MAILNIYGQSSVGFIKSQVFNGHFHYDYHGNSLNFLPEKV
jgi:hypothetical protein